jgi:tetratricopeptide (TPR) repeat protein
MRTRWLLLLAPLLVGFDLLQSPNRAVEAGNARMKGGKAEEALAEYDKAVKDLPTEPGAHFNRGAALYVLSRFDEAAGEFLRATEAKTPALKASAFYNLGNSYFKTDKYADAIAAYRRSLSLDPNDIRAKWNLELALKKKKDEDEKKKNDEKNKNQADKKQDQQDKQDKQDKKDEQAKNDEKKNEPKDQKKDDKDKQDEQAKSDEKKNEPPKKDEPKEQKKEEAKAEPQKPEKAADMKEIEAVLDNLERSPKDLEKERARLRAIRRAAPTKDW